MYTNMRMPLYMYMLHPCVLFYAYYRRLHFMKFSKPLWLLVAMKAVFMCVYIHVFGVSCCFALFVLYIYPAASSVLSLTMYMYLLTLAPGGSGPSSTGRQDHLMASQSV